MLPVTFSAAFATGLLAGISSHRPVSPLARGASRVGDIAMMPSSTPRVPYKYPGTDTPQWLDIYNRMYRERIMFMGQPIDDNFANTMIAVLLYLESDDAKSPVAMYCNSPGGLHKAGLAMYDTMRIMPYDIQTVNMGICADISAFVVAGGTPGKRFALPNARFAMMNPRIMPTYDKEGKPRTKIMQATEMQLEVEEVIRDKKRMLEGFSQFTGRSMDLLRADFSRDFYLSADEALQYGMVDKVLEPKVSTTKEDIKLGTFTSGDDEKFQGMSSAPDKEPPIPEKE